MNNEPVVWISEYTLKNCLQGKFTDEVRATTKETTNCTIPLYTHPVELTDEEIMECERWVFLQERMRATNDSWNFTIELARALLRKAQEK